MRSTRRKYLSLTPMIDVVFILLLFFLLSTQLQPHQILPVNFSSSEGNADEEPITLLEIGEDVYLNNQKIDRSNWLKFLKEGSKQPIAIRPDDSISLSQLIQYIDEIRESGISEIILVEGANYDE